MWHPWRELRNLPEVLFEITDKLPSGDAWWSPAHDVILMRPGLLQVVRRCRLAHELGHRTLGHSGCPSNYPDAERHRARMESNADGWAAKKLITIDALVSAGKWTSSRDEAADELWVTRHLLDVRLARLHPAERAMMTKSGVRL